MKQKIHTDKAPAALGPYFQAISMLGQLVFTSGQLGLDPQTGELPAGIEAQTKQSIANVAAVLTAAGSSLDNVVKTTVFIKDMNDFAKVNEIYAQYFTGDCPARSCIEIARLPKDALIEIEVIAVK